MTTKKMKKIIPALLAVSLLIAAALSPFASSLPDGLERVAMDLGFIEKGEGEHVVQAPLTDYTTPSISNEKFSTAIAGIFGTLIVFSLVVVFSSLLSRRSSRTEKTDT